MENWTMYIFQYGVGGAIFFFGLILSLCSCDRKNNPKEYFRYFWFLLFGLIMYALAHGAWIYLVVGWD